MALPHWGLLCQKKKLAAVVVIVVVVVVLVIVVAVVVVLYWEWYLQANLAVGFSLRYCCQAYMDSLLSTFRHSISIPSSNIKMSKNIDDG